MCSEYNDTPSYPLNMSSLRKSGPSSSNDIHRRPTTHPTVSAPDDTHRRPWTNPSETLVPMQSFKLFVKQATKLGSRYAAANIVTCCRHPSKRWSCSLWLNFHDHEGNSIWLKSEPLFRLSHRGSENSPLLIMFKWTLHELCICKLHHDFDWSDSIF